MANASVKMKIKNMGDLWGKARDTTKDDKGFGEAVPVDTGVYNMQIVDAQIDTFGDRRKLLTKWCVLDDGDFQHAICAQFDSIDDEERLVWVQRLARTIGIDLDAVEVNDEDDLLDLFKSQVEERVVCRVKVTEKDDFKNTRPQKVVDVEDDQKVDPEEVLKDRGAKGGNAKSDKPSNKSSRAAAKEEKEAEVAEVSLEEGDKVSWENEDGDTVEGEVVGFTDDEEAKVREDGQKKSIIKPLDALTKTDGEAPPGGSEGATQEIEVGLTVTHNGKTAEVTSVPPKGTKVQITYEKNKKVAMVEKDELEIVESEPEAEPEAEVTIDVGSKVVATIKGKDQAGVVKSISDDGETAKVKIGNQLVSVKVEDLAVEVDG